ncbi:MAG: glycosyl transferase family 1 [Bacteroidetes bacterium]|nr:glycosyl transferase family 1 [Bacteroidota bacterium]
MEARRRVLVIAYYFPPMGLSGVQRTAKFVKYLPAFGWHPTVLTVEPTGYIARDESLLEEFDRSAVTVARTPAAGPGRVFANREVVKLPSERMRKLLSRVSDTFFIPDNKIGWKRRAVARALELHGETPFDLIFTTAPPFTDFMIGAEVKEAIGKPLVFDYRDPWVDYPFKFYLTPFHRMRHSYLEAQALRASSHVIATSRRVKELLIKRYRFLSFHDVDIISQGFDPADFPASPGPARVARPGGKMRITYAGIFWEDRIPDHFLQALHDLFQERPKLRGRIEAMFVGTFRDENHRLVSKLGLQDAVVVREYLPHRECVEVLRSSDVLWAVAGDDLGTPGKLYEYIGARKPILALLPEGFLRQTVQEAGGTVVGHTDVPAIKAALAGFFDCFEKHALSAPDEEVVRKYDRRVLTGNLVKLFESLIEP